MYTTADSTQLDMLHHLCSSYPTLAVTLGVRRIGEYDREGRDAGKGLPPGMQFCAVAVFTPSCLGLVLWGFVMHVKIQSTEPVSEPVSESRQYMAEAKGVWSCI